MKACAVTRKTEDLKARLASSNTEKDTINILCELALELCEDDPQQAYSYALQAYERATSGDFSDAHYITGMVESMMIFAWHRFEREADYAAALEILSEGLSLAKSINYLAAEANAIRLLGLIHYRLGNYPQALDSFLKALRLARQGENQLIEGLVLRALALLYAEMGDYEQNLAYNEAALDIFAQINHEFYHPLLLNNATMSMLYLERYEEALTYGSAATKGFEKINSWRGLSAVEDSIGQVYAATGDFEQAASYFQKSVERIENTDEPARLSRGLLNMGKFYLQHKRPDDALPYLEQAMDVTLAIDSNPRLYECHEALSLAYEQKGDIRRAMSHHKECLRYYRHVVNEQSLQKLKLFEVLHRTEQAQAEAETQRQLREQERGYYERLSQMREQLISSTSHDLKNPLSAILNYVHLLDAHQKTNDDIGQRYLKRIDAQVEQMRDLIADLLDLARLETGRALKCEAISVQQFVGQIIADFTSQAKKKDIQLRRHIQPQDLTITIDPRQMRRVLTNLISNAIKYTPVGGKVDISIIEYEKTITIKVDDTGMGIPAKDLPHIFERFYRVDTEAHAAIDGTGLGLAIVKSIVEQHGGTVSVESNIDKGSRFLISIPLVASVAAT